MPSSSGTFTHYTGSLTSLSSESPGLRFFAAYISAIDALDRTSAEAARLLNLVSPDVKFITKSGNKDEPVGLTQIQTMFGMRSTMLSKFSHSDNDVAVSELVNNQGGIALVCETISVQVIPDSKLLWHVANDYFRSVFKNDTKEEEVRASELLMLKLEAAPDEKGIGGWWATEVKAYLDTSAIQAKAMSLMGKRD